MREVAANEAYIDVRKQLASSARRLRPELALPIIRELLRYDEDTRDIHQPLLIWWAIEAQAGQVPASQVLSVLLVDADAWNKPLVVEHVLERLMKRYALAGTRLDLLNAAALLNAAPDRAASDRLLAGFEAAFQGRSLAGLPDELVTALARSGGGSLALRLRQAQPDAISEAIAVIGDRSRAAGERQPLVEVSGQSRLKELLPVLLELITSEPDTSLRSAVFAALQNYDDSRIAPAVIARFAELSDDSALAAESLLVSRAAWSKELLRSIDAGTLAKDRLSDSAVRRMSMHNDTEIHAAIERLWGTLAGLSPAAAQAEIARVRAIVDSGSGNPRNGKRLFMQHCGRCHLLFEEGGRVGPDLTAFDRTNLDRMLTSIVNPSLEIREGFENFAAVTTDGRVLNGFLADKDSQVVILRGVDGQNAILRHDEIEDLHAVPQSVMPDGALKLFDDQQLRDLFAYLRSTQPVNY
jgi:putative heme-binding domain-containing protein